MREIIHFQAGKGGNVIGANFWNAICEEHTLDTYGKFTGETGVLSDRLDTYFSEGINGTRIPRAVIFDLDRESVDYVAASYYAKLYRPENYIYGHSSAASNWCKGHYTDGAELIDAVLDAARREVENCDSLQGFQLAHTLGGGTGSGMGTLLIDKLREQYPSRIVQAYSVMPSSLVSDCLLEPYNAVLAMHHLVENADSVMMFDNEALYNICARLFKPTNPSYGDLNHFVTAALSAITCPFRFPGQLYCDMRKTIQNLVPYPRIHFFTVGPLNHRQSSRPRDYREGELTQQMARPAHSLCQIETENGYHIAASAIFRGKVCFSQVEKSVQKLQKSDSLRFLDWIPDSLKTTTFEVGLRPERRSAALISNTSAIQRVFKRVSEKFAVMYRRKAYVHCFSGQGMDQMEFTECQSNLNDLISEYQWGNTLFEQQFETGEEAD